MLQFDFASLWDARAILAEGAWITLKVTLVAIACGIALGTLLAVCAVVRVRALNAFARAYVTLFRSIPLVMLLLWFFLIVPQLLKSIFDLSPSVDIRLVSAITATSALYDVLLVKESIVRETRVTVI